MIVDRRKDSYDELQILAGDVRTRRRRTNLWTTGLIVGGMVATAYYVGATNDQVDGLKGARDTAELERDALRAEILRVIEDRNGLIVQRDIYKDLVPAEVSDQITQNFYPSSSSSGGESTPSSEQVFLTSVVWFVDGSRRFPMAENEFLWIPEAGIWVQLADFGDRFANPPRDGRVRIFSDPANRRPTTTSTGIERTLPLQLQYQGEVRGNANYACLTLHQPSIRPGFQNNPNYADMEILLIAETCPDRISSRYP